MYQEVIEPETTPRDNRITSSIPPFAMQYSPAIPELLMQLNISLALTTYQAGKLVTISPKDENSLISLPRTFEKPMGVALDGDRMAIACKDEVIYLENSKELAKHYPNKPNTYDNLFVPKVTYHTGQVDMHDLAFGKEGLWAINTSFSCLCQVDESFNFMPKWRPKFISDLVSEDRCHLNGLVMQEGHPRYVTALGQTDTPQGWRDNITTGGVLIDLRTDEVIVDRLAMPHSPMFYNGELYLLLSASGQLAKIDIESKRLEVVKDLEGFCRGMDIIGDYAFIGMSKLRKNSSTFAKLDFAEKADQAGIKIVHLPTKALVGEIVYQSSVDEIYDVKILEGMLRPNVLNTINPLHKYSLSIPGKTFWAKTGQEPENSNQ
ncbi:MAG: TIGR03032 family protein [Reichenbachiella sp.]|uniref:TIGR03032 family protein n=1 Tax=Reichenbachiella sp. TaxID=2184521 RepID=UPI0032659D5F